MKKPWLATLLNTLPLGFGYLYLGLANKFALTCLGAIGAFIVGVGIALYMASMPYYRGWFCNPGCGLGDPTPIWFDLLCLAVGTVPLLLLVVFTARDARRGAMAINSTIAP